MPTDDLAAVRGMRPVTHGGSWGAGISLVAGRRAEHPVFVVVHLPMDGLADLPRVARCGHASARRTVRRHPRLAGRDGIADAGAVVANLDVEHRRHERR